MIFYESNENYRVSNREQLNKAQQEYWSNESNRLAQSQRVTSYFANNPQARLRSSQIAKEQWDNQTLLKWRRQKTQEQWTPEFRTKRLAALNQTYYVKRLRLSSKSKLNKVLLT
ncbi:MAG: hypothetical protein HC787_05345 [Nostocaceae cyanobacterium CSU_2_110]|nr:hypothetical protein [Nostocaceae cyanobacterium CSU_2_110]